MRSPLGFQHKKEGVIQSASRFLQHAAVCPTADHTAQPEPASALTKSSFGQDFSHVPVHTAFHAAQSELTASCGLAPTRCPFGGACHICPAHVQAKPLVSQPRDTYEQEADQVAAMTAPAASGAVWASEDRQHSPPGQLRQICSECEEERRRGLRFYSPTQAMGNTGVSHQMSPEEGEAGTVEEGLEFYTSDGLLIDNAGSGTCVNGGGGSSCNTATGKHEVKTNSNTCCTKVCTQEHEETHVRDRNGWGCCKRLSDALKKPGADANDLITKFNAWSTATSPITECNAYSHDVVCADRLAKDKDCSGKGKDTDCCKDILDYKARYGALAKSFCKKAPKKAAPCPF